MAGLYDIRNTHFSHKKKKYKSKAWPDRPYRSKDNANLWELWVVWVVVNNNRRRDIWKLLKNELKLLNKSTHSLMLWKCHKIPFRLTHYFLWNILDRLFISIIPYVQLPWCCCPIPITQYLPSSLSPCPEMVVRGRYDVPTRSSELNLSLELENIMIF